MKRVLILYISQYSGHFHAASAIEKGLTQICDGGVDVHKINAFTYTNPILEKIINKTYLEVIKTKPEIWGRIYDNPDVLKKTRKAREALYKFNVSKITKLLEAYSADIVFCTQAFPCGMVADYKRVCGSQLPLVGVLTDYAPHSYWLFDEVNFYCVPSEETALVLSEKGVPAQKIKAYGIPVDPKFRVKKDKNDICKRLGLKEENPTVLIMGGTQGLGDIEEIVGSISGEKRHDYQLLVVAGSNKKLHTRLEKMNHKKYGGVHIFPFVDNIDELMEISDLIITKAGGMTVAESMVKGLPMIIVNPIPGHERMNTDYLVSKGAAIEVQEGARIHESINNIFDSKDLLDAMKKNARELAKPDSSLDIARLISA